MMLCTPAVRWHAAGRKPNSSCVVCRLGSPLRTPPSKPAAAAPAATRRVFSAGAGAAFLLLSAAEPALADNAAILQALKAREQDARMEEEPLLLARRLRKSREQLARINLLAEAGDYQSAREQLRLGAFSTVRKDMLQAQQLLSFERVTFDRFEGNALVSSVESLDALLRQGSRGGGEGVGRDSIRRSTALVREALDEVISLLPDPDAL